MDFRTWLRAWLSRHPLKAPVDLDRARFTAEVMERVSVRAERRPVLVLPRLAWPQVGLAAAGVVAVLLLAVVVHDQNQAQVVEVVAQVEQETEVLLALDESIPIDDTEQLAWELERLDAIVLAEDVPDDDAWIEETLGLLEELDEDLPTDEPLDGSEDEWFEELELLDNSELLVST